MTKTTIRESPRGRRLKWLLGTLLAGQFIANVDVAIVNVAAPTIRADLHTTGGELQLVVAGYTLAYAMLLITGARLGHVFGNRRLFLIGVIGFTVASLLCGLAPSTTILIVARIAQGGMAAMMVPQVLSGIQRHFSGTDRAGALGLYALALSGGAVVGQVLGGVLVTANVFGSQWRSVFLINIPIGIALVVASLIFVPEDAGHQDRRLDLPGVGSLSIALCLIVVPLVLGRDFGWPSWCWIGLAAALPALGVFVAVERRMAAKTGSPLINLEIFEQAAVSWGLFALAAASSTYFSLLFVLALYLQKTLGESPLYSGLALISWVAAFGIAGPLLPRVPTQLRSFVPVVGYIVLSAAYAGISAFAFATENAAGPVLFAALGFGGLGLGIGFSSIIAHLTSVIDKRFAPDMSGILTTASQLSGVIGIAVFGTLYLSLETDAFAVVTATFAGTAAGAAFAAFLSERRKPER